MDNFQLNSAYSQLTKNNIGAFISDVHSAFINKTVPTLTLINLLDKKSETCNSIGWLDRHPDGISDAERDTITVYGIVIAAEMLLLFDIHSHSALRKKALAFLECASALIKQQYDFIGKAVDALNHDFTSLGYDWAAVQNAFSLDVLAYSFCSKSTHTASFIPSSSFFGQGCVQISNGLVSISSSRINDNSAKSFELSGGKIEILTRNTRTDKLKASDISNVESINSFAKTFIASQKEMLNDDTHEYKNKLAVGDVVTIKCTSWEQHDDGHVSMSCVALDVHDCPEGVIEDEELIKGTYTEDIIPYLYGGDCIRGAIVLEAGEAPVFSIKQAYRAFAKERSKEDFRNNLVFEAKAVAVIDKIQRINWITSRGYGGISQMMDNIKEGDMAVMSILNRQDSGDNIYINIAPPKYGYEKIDERFEDENVILGFATDVKTAVENLKNLEECRKGDGMNDVVRSLARIILNSSTATDCLESYRRLLASSFLFNCIEDNDRANIALSKADYLKSCISFAQSGTPLPTSKSSVFSEDQRKILLALALFNTSGSVCQLASLIGDGEADSLCNKISELIMAREISASFNDEVKASSDGIRK